MKEYEDEILGLLKDSRVDHKVALVFCRQFNFKPGLVLLLSDGPVADLSELLRYILKLYIIYIIYIGCSRFKSKVFRIHINCVQVV